MEFDLGVHARTLLSMKAGSGAIENDQFIGISKGIIQEVSALKNYHQKNCVEWIDASDQIVIPGLVNGHTHLAMSLFRGYEDDLPFQEWLFKRIFPIEAEMVDADFVKTGVELSALECIRFGTTTVNDMYFFAATTAKVLEQAGLRGIVSWPFLDFLMPDERMEGDRALATREARFKAFFQSYQGHPRIKAGLAPHAPYTCSDETIKLVDRIAREHQVNVHMHVSETKMEVEESLKKYGMTPVERLSHLGILDPRFILAHGVHLNQNEMEILQSSGVSVIHNPDSNLKLGSGIAAVKKLREMGISCGLGSDGAASNNDLSLFGAMDLATKTQKMAAQDSTAMIALDALQMATIEGARALGLEKEIGSIEVGKKADLVCLRTDLPHVQPLHSVLSQLVYAYQGLEVDQVVVGGKILFQKGKYLTLDAERIFKDIEVYRNKIQNYLNQSG